MAVYERAGSGGEVTRPQPPRLPILEGFTRETLPFLLVLWTVLLVLYGVTGAAHWWAVLPWATVTILMLWPVGHSLGRGYFSYRSPLFILGVLSMGYIIFTGFAMQSDWPYPVKLAIFLLLPVDLTIFGIVPGLRWAIGKPIGMFFRPDLLFGDGRVLCCGTIALVLGMRYFVGHPPPEGIPIPIPRWDWYAIFYAITLGFVPLIAVRGVLKLLLRVRRIRDDRWAGWVPVVLRELLLVLTVVNIGFGFHNVFKGYPPFVVSETTLHSFSWVPISGLILATLFMIFVRGGYKRRIGEPFIKETLRQTWIKELLYVLGIFVLMWSLMSILDTTERDIAHAGYAVGPTILGQLPAQHVTQQEVPRWPESGFILGGMKGIFVAPWNWVGLALFIWGLIVIVPFRVLAQHFQRQAIVAQMAAVVVPTFSQAQRGRFIDKMFRALLEMAPGQRITYLRAMNEGLAAATAEDRAVMTRAMLSRLVALEEEGRDRFMGSMALSLGQLKPEDRVTRMADMMGAVSELPQEQRRMMMQKMLSLLS